MKQFKELVFLFAALFIFGCDNSISPTGQFKPQMVVFSILSTASDTQYVRIYSNYSTAENDPLKNPEESSVRDAAVTVSDGTISYPFHFVTIPRIDTTRYKSPVGLYVSYPFRSQENKRYTFMASSPTLGQVISTTVVPGKGYVACGNIAELSDPASRSSIRVFYSLGALARAFLVRFVVTYTTENPGDNGNEHYREVLLVPLPDTGLDALKDTSLRFVPHVITTAAIVQISISTTKAIEYAFPAYYLSVSEIIYNNVNVKFKRAVFYLVQFDEPWYKYYASSNLSQEKLGMRIDPPYYTNIQGGSGLFGSFQVDSAVVVLPEKLSQ